MNFPFGQLGSSGRIEQLDFVAFGYGEESLTVDGPGNNGSQRIDGGHWVLNGDELVAIMAIKNADDGSVVRVDASRGDTSPVR